MQIILDVFFLPGVFIGAIIFYISCKLGVNTQEVCMFSGTSAPESFFIKVGVVIFYGSIAILILRKIIRNRK